MKNKFVKLDIVNPCEKDWKKMSPTPNRRFCHHCEHELIDFTKMTDVEIGRHYQNHKGKLCALLRKDQLKRPIMLPRQRTPVQKWKAIAAVSAGLLTAGTSMAQINSSTPEKIEIIETAHQEKIAAQKPSMEGKGRVLRGNIKLHDGEPAIGTIILIKNTDNGTVTDLDGNFELNTTVQGDFILLIADIEHESIEIETPDFNTVLKIQMKRIKDSGMEPVVVKVKGTVISSRVDEITVFEGHRYRTIRKLIFKTPSKGTYLINIYNHYKNLVYTQSLDYLKGKQSIELDSLISQLPTGSYDIEISGDDSIISTYRVYKRLD